MDHLKCLNDSELEELKETVQRWQHHRLEDVKGAGDAESGRQLLALLGEIDSELFQRPIRMEGRVER